jgi:ATP-dependent 26S proteasome regulatory subunit
MSELHIVTALCRQVIKDGASDGALLQIERLYDCLKSEGKTNESKTIKRLLNKANVNKLLVPSKVELSRTSHLSGQELTINSKIPVDKDSGAPLARILYPSEIPDSEMPILSNELEKAVNQLIKEWDNADRLAEYGLIPSLSCLLFGAPGTGKTQLSLYIAKKLNLPIVVTRLDGLVSSLLGTSARNITNLFNFADQHNCILLLDEFDAVAKARDDKQEVGEIKRIVNTLLQCIDSRSGKGMTIAITNHEVLLDPAVWRRFEVRVFVPKPNLESRHKLIHRFASPLKLSLVHEKLLAYLSDGFSGSDIESMLMNFKRNVVLSGKDLDFYPAVKSFLSIFSGADSELSCLISKSVDAEVMRYLNKDLGFIQKEIGHIFNINPSKVSRTISEIN